MSSKRSAEEAGNDIQPDTKCKKLDRDSNSASGIKHPTNFLKTPLSILSLDGCKVQTLTVSDQHVTLLLTNLGKEGKDQHSIPPELKDIDKSNKDKTSTQTETKSLLKLTLISFHKILLGSNPVRTPDITKKEGNIKPELRHDPVASDCILSFLQKYDWKLKSESGAEYSYYVANPSKELISWQMKDDDEDERSSKDTGSASAASNDVEKSTAAAQTPSTPTTDIQKINPAQMIANTLASFGSFDVELISPANDRQISRAMPSVGSTLVQETPELYQAVVQPYIKSIVDDGTSLGWIQNVIKGKKEKERLLVDNEMFIVNIDTKWRSHPDPNTIPRDQWKNHESTSDLYCLGIVKQFGIASLRDLTNEHLPLLKSIQEEGLSAIEIIYGVDRNQIRCFVHYQPQFYHFHVHFTRLANEIGSTVEKGHLVSDVIQNLELDGDYYKKRTITYKLKNLTPLQKLIKAHC